MGKQVSPVFDAVEAEARRHRDPYRVAKAAVICKMARKHKSEINALRDYRQKLREVATREPKRHGTLAMLDMHLLELEAIAFLCPEFRAPNGEQQKKGLRWVEKQDWAKEFLPPAYEKVRY